MVAAITLPWLPDPARIPPQPSPASPTDCTAWTFRSFCRPRLDEQEAAGPVAVRRAWSRDPLDGAAQVGQLSRVERVPAEDLKPQRAALGALLLDERRAAEIDVDLQAAVVRRGGLHPRLARQRARRFRPPQADDPGALRRQAADPAAGRGRAPDGRRSHRR